MVKRIKKLPKRVRKARRIARGRIILKDLRFLKPAGIGVVASLVGFAEPLAAPVTIPIQIVALDKIVRFKQLTKKEEKQIVRSISKKLKLTKKEEKMVNKEIFK